MAVNSSTPFRSFRRRGLSSGDAFQEYQGCLIGQSVGSLLMVSQNTGTPCHVANSVILQQIREPLWIISAQTSQKQRKGTTRWCFVTEGGVNNQTFFGGTYMQVSSSQTGPGVVGPWDTFTIGLNA